MEQFDTYARDYNSILAENTSKFGESTSYFADYKAHFIDQNVGIHQETKILDYGCGIGNLSAALLRIAPQAKIHGYDVSKESLRAIPSEVSGNAIFTSDLEKLDSDYNIAVLAGVLHHIPIAKRIDVLTTVTSKIRKNGTLIVFEHNPYNPITRKTVNDCIFDEDAILLKPKETVDLFRRIGLSRIKRDFTLFFPGPLKSFRRYENNLKWCPLGAQYVVSGKV